MDSVQLFLRVQVHVVHSESSGEAVPRFFAVFAVATSQTVPLVEVQAPQVVFLDELGNQHRFLGTLDHADDLQRRVARIRTAHAIEHVVCESVAVGREVNHLVACATVTQSLQLRYFHVYPPRCNDTYSTTVVNLFSMCVMVAEQT